MGKTALRVLVAEANEVNQLRARRTFEKLGYRVTLVGNGQEAVSALERGSFDLVAMDVQMPVMDGLAATAAIRRFEEKAGTHTPIVAMTAHAMKGDRERCLEAGMDGYVAKPIRTGELQRVLSEVLGSWRSPTIDQKGLLDGLNGNRTLLRQLARLFLADEPKRLEAIRTAFSAKDCEALGKAAHALKGSAANFGAAQLVRVLGQVEAHAKTLEFEKALKYLPALESGLTTVRNELKALAGSTQKSRSRGK